MKVRKIIFFLDTPTFMTSIYQLLAEIRASPSDAHDFTVTTSQISLHIGTSRISPLPCLNPGHPIGRASLVAS